MAKTQRNCLNFEMGYSNSHSDILRTVKVQYGHKPPQCQRKRLNSHESAENQSDELELECFGVNCCELV